MAESATSILNSFNLITTGDVTTTADIEGAVIVGGNLSGSTIFNNSSDLPASKVVYDYGNQTGNLNIDNGGTIYVQGSYGTISLNGGAELEGSPPNALSYYTTPLDALTTSLDAITTNTTGASVSYTANGDTTFISGPGNSSVAVINLSVSDLNADLSPNQTPVFQVSSGVTLVINVTGGGTFTNSANWNSPEQNVIFNFEMPTTVNVGSLFEASILDPGGTVNNNAGDINGSIYAATYNGSTELHNYTFDGDPNPLCYAVGTRILTPTGEQLVESLRAGDVVMALSGTTLLPRPVKWVGHRRLNLTKHPKPELAAPILIERSAFADELPQRDLRVSPDHAILVDGKLICARQLINGSTIRQQRDVNSVEYFHVELDEHGILLAEGLTAESYLDTGNRGFFESDAAPLILHPDLASEADYPSRESLSCAPFVWDEASVKPVWQQLAHRAVLLGHPEPETETTTDPRPCLIVGGETLRPVDEADGTFTFILPRSTDPIRLVTRANSPTDVRPWLEDRRCLGAYVERITLQTPANDIVDLPMDHPDLSDGWWAVEREGTTLRRWTNGDAVLPLPAIEQATMLQVQFAKSSIAYVTRDVAERRFG